MSDLVGNPEDRFSRDMALINQFIRRLNGWFESCLSVLLAQLKHGALTPGSYVIKVLDSNFFGHKLLLFCI